MRVNIYGEELRDVQDEHGERVTLIHRQVVAGFKHSAIQILLGERVIHTKIGNEIDDDTPAIKFWFADEYQRGFLIKIFEKALAELDQSKTQK